MSVPFQKYTILFHSSITSITRLLQLTSLNNILKKIKNFIKGENFLSSFSFFKFFEC